MLQNCLSVVIEWLSVHCLTWLMYNVYNYKYLIIDHLNITNQLNHFNILCTNISFYHLTAIYVPSPTQYHPPILGGEQSSTMCILYLSYVCPESDYSSSYQSKVPNILTEHCVCVTSNFRHEFKVVITNNDQMLVETAPIHMAEPRSDIIQCLNIIFVIHELSTR